MPSIFDISIRVKPWLWGPVLVKIILTIFSETELIKLFVQLILWCLLNNYFYSPNYFYVFNILFFTSSKSR